MRASELVGPRGDDIEAALEGFILHLRRSKTDQEGKGRKIGIPLGRTCQCPATALTAGKITRPIEWIHCFVL